MNSPVQQLGNPSNILIEQMEGRGIGNEDVLILLSLNSK